MIDAVGSFFVGRIHRISLSRACERGEPAQPSTLQNKFSCSKAPPYSAPIAQKFTYTVLLPFERSVEIDQEGADSQLLRTRTFDYRVWRLPPQL